MSVDLLSALSSERSRRELRAVDGRDLLALKIGRGLAFGSAALGISLWMLSALTQRDSSDLLRLWIVGSLVVAFLLGQMIQLKTRIIALEDRLGLPPGDQ